MQVIAVENAQAKTDLGIISPPSGNPLSDEVESCFVRNVVNVMHTLQRFIASMPEVIAGAFATELLFEKPS